MLEQVDAQQQPPHQTALLGNYLDKFIDLYQERMSASQEITSQVLSQLAWKLLIDLLFYSSNNGSRWLWLALISSSKL